jgi:cobalt-zinc-cadmium resistance protein CzcA
MAKRRTVVGINVQGRDLGSYVAELQQKVNRRVELPAGYFIQWGGQFQNMQPAMRHLAIIVPVTIGAIFFPALLAFPFTALCGSDHHCAPLASIGGVLGLFFFHEYLSVPASVGFIALWGIAVLNGVVLVSYVRKLRNEGLSQLEAIMRGTHLGFRPVMMTATVAALGLVPFLFARGPGSETQRSLAIVVIGGLITSTMLTLLVVPCLYTLFEGKPADVADQEMEHHLLS